MSLTQPTWPEACQPIPQEFLEWLLAQDTGGQLDIVTLALGNAAAAADCFLRNHHGLQQELRHAQQAVAAAYSDGFQQAITDVKAKFAEADA